MSTDPANILQQFLNNGAGQSDEELAQRFHTIISHLPADVAKDATNFAFSQLPTDAQQTLETTQQQAQSDDSPLASAKGFGVRSLAASDPAAGPLGGLFSQDSELGSTIKRMALAALVTYLTQRFLSGNAEQGQSQQSQQGGLGSILGSILGGQQQGSPSNQSGSIDLGSLLGSVLSGSAQGGGRTSNAPAGGVDVGSLLSVLLGAAGSQQTGSVGLPKPGQTQPSSAPAAGGVDLGSILGGLINASQSQGGASSNQAGGLDIGSILGGLLGGSQDKGANDQDDKPNSPLGSIRKDRS